MGPEIPELEFEQDWSILGPFQIGTRGTYEPFPPDVSERHIHAAF
jgi:hypothetical protein